MFPWNPSTKKAEAVGCGVQHQPGLHSETIANKKHDRPKPGCPASGKDECRSERTVSRGEAVKTRHENVHREAGHIQDIYVSSWLSDSHVTTHRLPGPTPEFPV